MDMFIEAAGAAHSAVLAQGGGEIGTGGISDWVKENVIGLVILVGAAAALWAGSIGKVAKAVTILGGIVVGLMVVGIAIGGNWETIAGWLAGLIGG